MSVPKALSQLRLLVLQHCWGANAAPVFIVGAPRTGSSFLTSALIRGAGFSGSMEGHVTPLMYSLDRILHGYYDQMRGIGMLAIPENTISKIPESDLARALVDVLTRFNRRIFGRGVRILDKTVNVEAIEALPYLLSVWPQARVIYLTRDGVDNVISAQQYFKVSLEIAARNWAQCGRTWDRVVPLLDPRSHITISQNEFSRNPHEVAIRVADHLSLGKSRRSGFLKGVMRHTPEWRAARLERPPLRELPWSKEDIFTFLTICGPQMIVQGYASSVEVDEALSQCKPDIVSLGADRLRVLCIDDESFYRPLDDGFLAVPGREKACVLSYDCVETYGRRNLVGRVSSIDPDSHSVRVEMTAVCCEDGTLLGYETYELPRLASQNVSLLLNRDADRIDVVIRLLIGKGSLTNDSGWVNFSGLALR